MARSSTKLEPKSKPKQSRLPLWMALAGLVLLLFAGWAVWSSQAPAAANIQVKGAPRLKAEKSIIDHGDVKLGSPIRDDVRVTNIGDQPLRFVDVPYIEVLEGC